MFIPGFWIFLVCLLLPSRFLFADEATLTLAQPVDDVRFLQGDWRFSEEPILSMDPERFARLPLRNPLVGDFFYTMFSDLPERGSFVLAIRAEQPMRVSVMLGGMVAQGEFTLLSGDQRVGVYTPPADLVPADGRGRLQIPHPTFTLHVPAGLSYLVYSYAQQLVTKGSSKVSNAGLVGPFQFGSEHKIRQRFLFHELFLKIPMGVFACLFVYSLLIYRSRHREDKESLILAQINGFTFLRELLTQTVVLNFVPSSPILQVVHAFGTGLPLLVTVFCVHYLHFKAPSRWLVGLRAVVAVNFAVIAVNNVLMPFPNPWIDTSSLNVKCYLFNAFLFFFVFVPSTLVTLYRKRSSTLANFSVGVLFMAAGTTIDFVNSLGNYGWPWLAMWGGLVLSVLLAKNNSRMFAQAFDSAKNLNVALTARNHEFEVLNQSLEHMMSKRTAEMRLLLEHIPQGVLSIGAEGRVESSHSAHLPDVLGTTVIGGVSFRTLFLDHLELGSDDRDQAWQAIVSAIGENALTFELNSDKLPTEAVYVYEGRRKILKLTWNIEADANGQVQHILVTMLDVTAEERTRQELEEKNTDLSLIRQLLDAGARKSTQFFSSSELLLRECEQIIKADRLDEATLKILFVNIHTIKGAARTLQFKALSTLLHAAESHYTESMRGGLSPDLTTLRKDLARVRGLFERTMVVNREVLGRDNDFARVPLDRDFLETHCGLLQSLGERVSVPSDLVPQLQKDRETLLQSLFLPIRAALDDILGQVDKIARDLQKETPLLQLNLENVLINPRQENALKNSFLHLLRNSLDHGIETAEERLKRGKGPRATLFVQARQVAHQLILEYWDDGRGLALTRIQERAQALGLVLGKASAHEIANTIFEEGVSTARSLSQISGRGLGMSAVKRFLEAEEGRIEIVLPENAGTHAEYVPFRFRMTLPLSLSGFVSGHEQVA